MVVDESKEGFVGRLTLTAESASVASGRSPTEVFFRTLDSDPLLPTVVLTLIEALFQKDPITAGHSRRVMSLSRKIGVALGLSDEDLAWLSLSALMHDLGKIGVDDRVLKKDSALLDSEWQQMKTHPGRGVQILKKYPGASRLFTGMEFHHERWDGGGYPHGLSGDAIPLDARIIAVADAYDAMVSRRPYSQGRLRADALKEIDRGKGSQFDPRIVDVFIHSG